MSNTRCRGRGGRWGRSLIVRSSRRGGRNRCRKCNRRGGWERSRSRSRIITSSWSTGIKGYRLINRMRCRLLIWNLRISPIKPIPSSSKMKVGRRGYRWIRVKQGSRSRIWCWMGIYLWCRYCPWKMGSFRILSDSRVMLWLIASRVCRIWGIFRCWIWMMIVTPRWARRRRQSRRRQRDRRHYKQSNSINRKGSKVDPLWTLLLSI